MFTVNKKDSIQYELKRHSTWFSFDWYVKLWRGWEIVLKLKENTNNMKILQLTVRSCATLGYGPHQSTTQKYPINIKTVQAFFIICLALIFSCAYYFFEANTFDEYTLSVFVSATLMLVLVVHVILVWKNQPICELLDSFEKTVNERKQHFTYQIPS